MNILLWVLQIVLALAYVAHGWLYLYPPAEIAEALNASIPPALRIFIGIAEVAAAAGLILPGVTRVPPWLVPCAAAGLMIVMICATAFHLTRGEIGSAVTTTVLLVLVTFVAYMRWKVVPIRARTAG
jgi:uncharacterized membrane protein YphA (DoxX/SURF4 family)